MPSISSLLKSAESARKKKQAYDDEIAAFIWQNSAKTIDDWAQYQAYLTNRQQNAPTPNESLSYVKKLKSAEDSYVSAEIERETISILDGTGTTTTKYEKVVSLYERAVERGNFDLAQNLYLQAQRLEEQIINEQERGQKLAGSMALNQVKDVKSLIAKLNGDTPDEYIELGDGRVVKTRTGINNDLKTKGQSEINLFDDALDTARVMQELVQDAYDTATTQEAVDKIEGDPTMRKILMGEYTFTIGGQALTLDQLDLASRSAAANNPLYTVATTRNAKGETTFTLVKNEADDFIWARNPDGTYEAVEVQAIKGRGSLNDRFSEFGTPVGDDVTFEAGDKIRFIDENGKVSVITAKGGEKYAPYTDKTGKTAYMKSDSTLNVKNRLENLGYQVIGSGNTFSIVTPDG